MAAGAARFAFGKKVESPSRERISASSSSEEHAANERVAADALCFERRKQRGRGAAGRRRLDASCADASIAP